MTRKPITKEYFDDRFREYQGDMHTMTLMLMDNMKAYYLEEAERHMGALKEGFIDEMRGTKDQVKSMTEKTDAQELRLCKLEEICYK